MHPVVRVSTNITFVAYGSFYIYSTILVLLRVFVAEGTCLPSRCLATKGEVQFTEPFLSKKKKKKKTHTHAHTHTVGTDF
jgi:hypothetical protein